MSTILADISAAQGKEIDFDVVAGSGLVSGSVCQASNGQTGRDQTFVRNFRELGRVGLVRGAYHFAHCDGDDRDATLEADNFIAAIVGALSCGSADRILGVLGDEDIILALDIETNNGTPKLPPGPKFVKWVLDWLTRVQEKTGITPFLYTGGPFFDLNDGGPDLVTMTVLAQYPLWLAAYVLNPRAFLPPEWMTAGYTMWQDSGDVAAYGKQLFHVPGIGGGKVNVDHDIYNGTLAELKTYLRYLAPRPAVAPVEHEPEHDDAPVEPAPYPLPIPEIHVTHESAQLSWLAVFIAWLLKLIGR